MESKLNILYRNEIKKIRVVVKTYNRTMEKAIKVATGVSRFGEVRLG